MMTMHNVNKRVKTDNNAVDGTEALPVEAAWDLDD